MLDPYLLACFGLDAANCTIRPTGSGLINHTYLVLENTSGKKYILQKVNTNVFAHPEQIAENTIAIADYLKKEAPGYLFIAPLPATDGKYIVKNTDDGSYRLFPFAEGSVTYNTATSPELARKAAAAFGKFTHLLKDYPATTLHTTLPDFHNLTLRYQQFERALAQGNQERIKQTTTIANQLKDLAGIELTYRQICANPHFIQRVTHHDTKISNVLFDTQGNTLCIIDLDTVMPGYFISDVGDMMRNYLSPANEEETNFSAIHIRMDYFEALASGYLQQMGNALTAIEKTHFVYSGKFLTYMQALRFYSDYLNDDIYYPVSHAEHNLVRTQNQLVLLEKMMAREKEMQGFVDALMKA
jgi:Ser/Thr protein kinase RdoA (MazF antagonist)